MVREALASRPSTDVGGRASLCVFFATASFAAAAAPSREVSDRDEASAAVARVPAKAAGPRSAAGVAVGHLCGRFERANRIWLQALQICSPPPSRAACVRIRARLVRGRARGKF